jgi:hypothetical protein
MRNSFKMECGIIPNHFMTTQVYKKYVLNWKIDTSLVWSFRIFKNKLSFWVTKITTNEYIIFHFLCYQYFKNNSPLKIWLI